MWSPKSTSLLDRPRVSGTMSHSPGRTGLIQWNGPLEGYVYSESTVFLTVV